MSQIQQSPPQKSTQPLQDDSCREVLSKALDAISFLLLKGKSPVLDSTVAENEKLLTVIAYIQEMQQALGHFVQGDYSEPIGLKGFSAGLIKNIQGNMRHLLWKAEQVAAGEFSQQIDFMGEISHAFNTMVSELNKARNALEEQKQSLAKLSEDLRVEIKARIAAEKDLKNEEMKQRQLATTDPLTGVANRRGFFQLAWREIERMRRNNAPACVAILDLDNFKTINDTYGHAEGDKVLCKFAEAVKKILRGYDIAGRYGGDEFILLFPETHLDAATTTLERLRAQIAADLAKSDAVKPFSISGGVTLLHLDNSEDMSALEGALMRADKALYESKLKGRDCISSFV